MKVSVASCKRRRKKMNTTSTINLADICAKDLLSVGGKNANLGEMISKLSKRDIRVPQGFAIKAQVFRDFLKENKLTERIRSLIESLQQDGGLSTKKLSTVGLEIREAIINGTMPKEADKDIEHAFAEVAKKCPPESTFAIRSSATSEDQPTASFAGQQDTLLNIQGLENVKHAVKRIFASLYTDRAISYRMDKKWRDADMAISVCVQQMVDCSISGVVFTIDTETGFTNVLLITSTYGLGELLVNGSINPDEFTVFKPTFSQGFPAIIRRHLGTKQNEMMLSTHDDRCVVKKVDSDRADSFSLSDKQVLEISRYAIDIESHYKCPMDIEFAVNTNDNMIYILQCRPETVKSQGLLSSTFRIKDPKTERRQMAEGRAVTNKIAIGRIKVVSGPEEMHKVEKGEIMVAKHTTPDYEPVMKKVAAVITDSGGRTCHSAIICREMGIPAVIGCSNATSVFKDGDVVTVDCSDGSIGKVYDGVHEFLEEASSVKMATLPKLPVKMSMNIANPDAAFLRSLIPNQGVGLARLEFIISSIIGVHPNAVLNMAKVSSAAQLFIAEKAKGYKCPRDFYVRKLAEGVGTIAAAFFPKEVIVRLSDFKTNEYRSLVGGENFERVEDNPMLGFRGALRYISDEFRRAFEMECEALNVVRKEFGLTNISLLIPFVRTVDEAKKVLVSLALQGLERSKELKIYMMCELPSNCVLADQFLALFDGFSLGTNDLTQLCLGADRDNAAVARDFDETDEAVKNLVRLAVKAAKRSGKYVGACGVRAEDEVFARWLIAEGVTTLSVSPDVLVPTALALAQNPVKKKMFS